MKVAISMVFQRNSLTNGGPNFHLPSRSVLRGFRMTDLVQIQFKFAEASYFGSILETKCYLHG